MSKLKGLAVFLTAVIFVGVFVSVAPASIGANTCTELFPGQLCKNGGCDSYGTAGNCTINNCVCRPGLLVDHDCKSGNDTPPCN